MKKLLLLSIVALLSTTSFSQFLYTTYTVENTNNVNGCSFDVTFVQSGTAGKASCIVNDTQTLDPGDSYTWYSGDPSCTIASVSFTVDPVGGNTSHTGLLNSSYNGQGGDGCDPNYGALTIYWLPTSVNTFEVEDNYIVGP